MNGEDKKKTITKEKSFFVKNWKTIAALSTSFACIASASMFAGCKKNKGDNSGNSSTAGTPSAETMEGLGVFYYDTDMGEHQLSLLDDGKAIYSADGKTMMGTYTVSGKTVTIKFDGKADMVASIEGNMLTGTQDGNSFRFYKKVFYTVSYDAAGGSAVESTQVVNGKQFVASVAPMRDGYEFWGWYMDSDFTTPYIDQTVVTADMTLYARWVMVDPSKAAYTVDFDLGYDAVAPAAVETVAGKLCDAPVVTRDGYNFCGWWMSDDEDGAKLTRKWTENTEFTANTTLFAVWEVADKGSKISNPAVEVTADGITWVGIDGASRYGVKITDPTGYVCYDEETSTTSIAFGDIYDGVEMPAGDFKVEVTAIAQSGATNNSDTVIRWYKHKAVGRVSQFSVIDGMKVLFNRVPNAEEYFITVDCGDDDHMHTNIPLGDLTYFVFANCEMQEGGIRFQVTATADGYAPVTSEWFEYERSLGKVEGLTIDEDTQMVSWYPVKDATNYFVSITCGTHTHEIMDVGTRTSFSLKECGAVDGKVTVNVYAATAGYNSSPVANLEYAKTKLASPGNITMTKTADGNMLTWTAVEGATEYEIMIGTKVYTSTTNSVAINVDELGWVEGTTYEATVKAKNATTESAWADTVAIKYMVMGKVKYKAGMVTWEPVAGATGYEVQVNSAAIMKVDGGATSIAVELTQAGQNIIKVRYCDATKNHYGDWVFLTIDNAQEITFDHRNGDADKPADISYQYKVTGDKMTLPTPTRAGYTFAGWYNTAKGPETNGQRYGGDDGEVIFTDSQDIILYAYWKPATYKVNYVVGGDGTLDATFGEVVYTQDYKLDVPQTEGDTVFLGWFEGTTANSTQLTDNRGYSIKPWAAKADQTIYAVYINKVLEFTQLQDGTYSVKRGINATKVAAIEIPATYNNQPVTVVDGYAFKDCTRLISVTIPNSVTIVEGSAFQGCKRLQEVKVKDVIANSALATYWDDNGVLIHKDELTGHTQIAYYPQAKVGAYEAPEGVTEIPMNLFEKTQITEITIPSTVTVIRGKAFYNCATLEKINFAGGGSDNLVIEDGAFQNCANLSAITLPARLSELQINEETHTMTMFSGCSALTNINIELGNQTYASKNGVITNKAGTEIIFCPTARAGAYTIPQGIESIAPYAFYECTKLTVVTIPGYVRTVGDYAFAGCTRVARVEFTGGAVTGMKTNIGAGAFSNMSNLKEIVFDTGSVVSSIGERAFANATALRELNIPTTMTYVGDYAFEKAKSLHNVNFVDGDQGNIKFGNYVFSECTGLVEINLPKSVTELNLGVFDGCTNIQNVFVADDNTYYKDIEGVVYTYDGSVLMFFPKGRQTDDGKYVIPEGVTTISDGAFKGMHHIATIELPSTVTLIGKNAFANSGKLATLTFADGGTEDLTIDENAFAGCGAITTITLPERTKVVAEKAFYNVSMTSITFPAGLETIGNYAFANTALTSVEIPAGVANMGESVFAECLSLKTVTFAEGYAGTSIPVGMFYSSAVESITIPGTITEIGFGAFANCNYLKTVTFADGKADLVLGVAATSESGAVFNDKGVFAASGVTSIAIPDRVTLINANTFSGCSALATVTINETSKLSRIGENAFYSCSALKSIYIPGTVQNTPYVDENTSQEYAIGNKAFWGAGFNAADSIVFGESKNADAEISFGYEAFANLPMNTFNFPATLAPIYTIKDNGDGTKTAGWEEGISIWTFNLNQWGRSLKTINVADGGKYYASNEGALYKLEEVNGAYVKSILYYVPKNYVGNIPAGSTTGNYTLNIPYTVREVANEAANGCTSMRYLVFEATPDGTTPVDLVIGRMAFKGWTQSNFQTLTLPERLTTLGDYAFDGCTNIRTLTIPASLTTMTEGGYQFNGCTRLKTVTFATGCQLTAIPKNAFAKCGTNTTYKLTSIKIPASVTSIGSNAFDGCTKLATLDFEEGSMCTSIGFKAFNSTVITTLTLPDNITTLTSSTFGSLANLTTLQLPKSLSNISTVEGGQNRFLFTGLSKLTTLRVGADDDNDGVTVGDYYATKDGVLYNKNFTEIVYYPYAKPVVDKDTETAGLFVIPESVTSIGAFAFSGNSKGVSSLTHLVIGKNVTTIAYQAFYACSGLTKITLQEGRLAPLTLGDYAFGACNQLKGEDVEVNGEVKNVFTIPANMVFEGTGAFTGAAFEYIVFAGDNASTTLDNTFASCKNLVSVTNIPMTISTLNATFSDCTSLTEVTFQQDKNAMINMLQGTFKGCTALTKITLPNIGALASRLSTIGGTFEGCTALQEVIFTGDCTNIGATAFKDCVNLTSITMPSSVASIGYRAFYGCTALSEVNFAGGIEAIPEEAFYGCTSLTSMELPDFVSSIGKNAFYGCTSLTDFTFGAGVVTVEERAFYNATALTNVTWNEGLETIGNYAFYNARSLTALNMPSTLISIGDNAFEGCRNVASVTLQAGVTSIGTMAFAGCAGLTSFSVPASLEYLGIGVFSGCGDLTDVAVDPQNGNFSFENGILFNTMKTEIIFVFPSVTGDVVIPGSVLAIGEGAFENTTITSIVLPDTITVIPVNAFKGCKQLKSVTMPASLQVIGASAFEGCTSLTSITIPNTVRSTFTTGDWVAEGEGFLGRPVLEDIDGIGARAFANCTALETVIFEEGGTERLSIGDYAFFNCTNLKGAYDENTKEYVLTIPYRVRSANVALMEYNSGNGSGAQQTDKFEQSIGVFAFANCYSLEKVVFAETGVGTFNSPVMIQVGAFTNCTGLQTVKLSSAFGDYFNTWTFVKGGPANAKIIGIQVRAFDGCTALTNVEFPEKTFKDGLTIANSAFNGTKIEVPEKFERSDYSDLGDDRGEGRYTEQSTNQDDRYFVL